MTKTEGRKDDQGKLPWHLLPGDAVEEILKVLEFGAKKYSTIVENEWHALLLVPSVKNISISTQAGCVVAVMKSSYGKPILSSLSVNAKTGVIGNSVTDTECKNWQSAAEMIQNLVNEIAAPSGLYDSENTGSQKTVTHSSAKKVALYAAQPNIFTLTIATQQGDFVVSFAPDAITDSAFWTIVWQGLSERYGILKPQNQTGERNWEKGMAWHRPFAAMMRHMWAWWRREEADPETGLSHLAHAGCCLLFLISYEMREIGEDDRP